MSIFLIANMIVYGTLTMIWKSNNWINFFIKVILFGMFTASVVEFISL